ncbi:hypothetical protein COY27_03290 [Candidatus Woesearchaeota archaeon CG_4_10_14_0_2_um_filter_33_13]|nr:MAG: hypothetical protein COY27_03290 [Candidatus Woesearchaeota archaeon CG_4_10_14_0_2_um_filter_33_13]
MSSIQEVLVARDKASQKYEGARHLLQVTLPMVNDPKLLLGVIGNMSASLEYSMDAILIYERLLRLIPNYNSDFESRFNLFRYKSVRRNKIPAEIVHVMSELRYILEMHKKSPIEFQRGNRFVICDKDYAMKIVSLNEIKKQLEHTKIMLDLTTTLTSKYF